QGMEGYDNGGVLGASEICWGNQQELIKKHLAIAASRTRLWLPSGWGCRGRGLSRGGENLCRRRGPARERHWRRLLAMFSTARHSHEPLPGAPTLPSSSSRRCRCGREPSETRRRQERLVRLPSMPPRECMSDRGRKY